MINFKISYVIPIQKIKAYPADEIMLVSDRAGSHTSGPVVWPAESLLLPACSPELDPVERWFEELRAALSNEVFATIEAMGSSAINRGRCQNGVHGGS